jgi:hypothetical protein
MTQTGSQDLGWAERWGVVRLVREKLEFVAFFDTQEDAEAAASEAGVDYQACWVSYKDGLGFPIEEKDSKSNPLPAGLAVKRTSCRQ